LLELVRRARRRILHNELLCQGANACSAALVAFILLLVLGTQILSWYWAVLLPLIATGVALYRVRSRLPSMYRTAQKVDFRMHLADSLSTALFFSNPESVPRSSAELRRLQSAQAERDAGRVDVRQAVPYTVPQTAYIAAALLLVASSVFALRYGLTDRLDLKQPLARILQQSLGLGDRDQQASVDPRKSPAKIPLDDLDSSDGQEARPTDSNQQPDDLADNNSPSPSSQNTAADKTGKKDKSQSDADKADEEGQADQTEDPSEGQQSAANQKDGQKEGKESGSNPDSKSGSNSQSLMSKMKEAMQNLLSSMQPSPNSQQPQQNSSNQNGKSSKNQNKQQGNKGEKKNAQANDAQGQQASDDGEQAQNAQGQSAEKADSPLANKQPGSGAGNKDGSKDIKLAEQLAAMGKITEIIGKRSANITGEVTVDVQNTSQQLKTAYQERTAQHAQTGAEINRDEIPVALESYVEQYFEQVRKAPAKK